MARLELPVLPPYLYRYRSLTRRDESLRDEIRSIRDSYLYCPTFQRMNDAMEGFYDPADGLRGTEDFKQIVRRIYDAKSDHGIACFSETNENELMWAHYADNYAGICIRYKTQGLMDGLRCFLSSFVRCSIPARHWASLKTQENLRCRSQPIALESNPPCEWNRTKRDARDDSSSCEQVGQGCA